jgi:hypothetical protein
LGLPVPSWARDSNGAGITREMDLPCSGPKLKGDTEPPFTCGGDTRRSIIKTFVRNYINGPDGDANGNTLAESLVRKRIAELMAVWSNQSNYACVCEGETDPPRNSLSCCKRHRDGSPENDTTGCVGSGDYETSTAFSSGGKGCVVSFFFSLLLICTDS